MRFAKTLSAAPIKKWVLYGIGLAWCIWLWMISNAFTMGYHTPIPSKAALSIGGVLLTGVIASRRDWMSILVATVLFVVAVLPLILLWMYDRKPYGM